MTLYSFAPVVAEMCELTFLEIEAVFIQASPITPHYMLCNSNPIQFKKSSIEDMALHIIDDACLT